MAHTVTFRSAWSAFAIWFMMDILAYLFRDHLPAELDVTGAFERDFSIAMFLIGLWLFFRRPSPGAADE